MSKPESTRPINPSTSDDEDLTGQTLTVIDAVERERLERIDKMAEALKDVPCVASPALTSDDVMVVVSPELMKEIRHKRGDEEGPQVPIVTSLRTSLMANLPNSRRTP